MKTPEWLKPGIYGAACGAIALAVVGFSWGGWVTGGTAQRMAAEQSQADVVAAASSWERGDMVIKHGWATMPGTPEGNRLVARACADKIGI